MVTGTPQVIHMGEQLPRGVTWGLFCSASQRVCLELGMFDKEARCWKLGVRTGHAF